MKTKAYNVIILDKSGSMSSISRPAVDGVNETLGGIRSSRQSNPDITQLVTLVTFCGCETRVIYDNAQIEDVRNLTPADYRPCCMTPLYDAVGNTITRVHDAVGDNSLSMVSVTIVTDGYENASREFTGKALTALIDAYKNEGWMFAYIGADHDVSRVASQMHIDNVMQFDKTEEGVNSMFAARRMAQQRWEDDIYQASSTMTPDQLREFKRKRGKSYFADEYEQ